MRRYLLLVLSLLVVRFAGGCGDSRSSDPSRSGAQAGTAGHTEVERRLKDAIEDLGKGEVKSMALSKAADGTYSGTVELVSGRKMAVKNVIVQANKIDWEETIDQTAVISPLTPMQPPPATKR
jgi:hypothetical protein